MPNTLQTIIAASAIFISTGALAQDTRHGIRFGYAPNSSASLSGKHLNLYNPVDPSSYRVEETTAEGAEISAIFSLGYQLRKPLGERFALDLSLSLTQANIDAQQVELVSKEGPYRIRSDQPAAEARYLELYAGGIYQFDGSAVIPYLGAGASLLRGKAYNTYYNLQELLAGAGTYGQSGSENMDGVGFTLKAGVQFERWALELSHGRYDAHIDSFRSFEIDGADLEFDQTMLTAVLLFGRSENNPR